MKKCPYCFTPADPGRSACAVCGIDHGKQRASLSKDEKSLAYRCRTLYTLGFLSIVGGGMGLFLTLPAMILGLRGQTKNLGIAPSFLPYYVTGMLLINGASIFFGLALRRYRKECLICGIALYSLLLAWSVMGMNFALTFVAAVYLAYLAAPPSRRILRAR